MVEKALVVGWDYSAETHIRSISPDLTFYRFYNDQSGRIRRGSGVSRTLMPLPHGEERRVMVATFPRTALAEQYRREIAAM
jgi:hypothetical protein